MKPKMSLVQIWTLLLTTAVVLPSILLLNWFGYSLYTNMLSNALHTEQKANNALRNKAQLEIQRLQTILQNKSDPLVFLLKDLNAIKDQDAPEILQSVTKYLNLIIKREPTIHHMMALSTNEKIIAIASQQNATQPVSPFSKQMATVKSYNETQNSNKFLNSFVPLYGGKYTSPPQLHDNHMDFMMSVPIGNPAQGVLQSIINIDFLLQSILTQPKKNSSTKPQHYILDTNGILATTILNNNYSIGDQIDHIVSNNLMGEKPWQSNDSYIGVNGQPVFGIITTLNELDLILVSEIIATEITKPITTKLLRIGFIAVVGLLFFILIMACIAKKIIRPLREISNATQKVAKGDYNLNFSQSGIEELNEILLGFGKMTNEIKNSEQSILKREKDLETTLYCIDDAVITTDTSDKITRINPIAEKLTGCSAQEAIGQPLKTIFKISDSKTEEPTQIMVPEEMRLGKMLGDSSRVTLTSKQGKKHQIIYSNASINNKSGNSLGAVLVLHDITQVSDLREEAKSAQKRLLDSMYTMIVITNINGEITFVNLTPLKSLGIHVDDILGEKIWDTPWFNYDPKIQDTIKNNCSLARKGHVIDQDIKVSTISKKLWLSYSINPVLNADNQIVQLLHEGRDITKRKHAETELMKVSRALDFSASMAFITDSKGIIEYINPKFTKITGYTAQESIGTNFRKLMAGESSGRIYDEILMEITKGDEWQGQAQNMRKDGGLYWARISIAGIKNDDGAITNFICVQEDVTNEYELSEQISHQASHDALTGLVNRREFERRVTDAVQSAKQGTVEHALCYMDLDQFKIINDTCGHAAGDEMLRQLSITLQSEVRKRDTLARLGGDEFGVLLECCLLDDASRTVDLLQKAIQNFPFSWEGKVFRVGVSMGLVAINKQTLNVSEVMQQADAACFMAKDMGRNRIHIYHYDDPELTLRHGEMQWVSRIHEAIDKDLFCLYAQTIQPLKNQNNIKSHYEVLIRMVDYDGKIIPPGSFLPAAERYNLITKIDRWVVSNTAKLLAENPEFQEQVNFISVNLSGQSLADESFLNFVITQLENNDLNCKKICFEITETAAIANLAVATEFFSTLKFLGCKFALDDFGSGLSSFAYLKKLPVDYLKIDGLFVKDIVTDKIDYAMVKSINEIGAVMGIKTIAEFVENDDIKKMLLDIGVDYVQGYGISKPAPFSTYLVNEKKS